MGTLGRVRLTHRGVKEPPLEARLRLAEVVQQASQVCEITAAEERRTALRGFGDA